MNCKEHFSSSNLRPIHDNPKTFIISEWQFDKEKPSLLYFLIKFAIFLTFFVVWILTMTMESTEGRKRWPVYLTNWGLTLCLCQSFLSCVMLGVALVEAQLPYKYYWTEKVLQFYSTHWVLNIMATTVAFTISLIYWTLIYAATGYYWSTMNFMVHGFNSILMMLELWIVSHPVRILHAVYPFILGLTYVTMTALFFVLGGTMKDGTRYIYPILKWDEPGVTIAYCIGIMIVMIIIHTLTFLMFKLREKVAPPVLHYVKRKLFSCWVDGSDLV